MASATIDFKSLSRPNSEWLILAFINLDLSRMKLIDEMLEWLEANPDASRAEVEAVFNELYRRQADHSRTMEAGISNLLRGRRAVSRPPDTVGNLTQETRKPVSAMSVARKLLKRH